MTGSPRAGAICGAIVGVFLAWATGSQRVFTPSPNAIELRSEAEFNEVLEGNEIVLAAFHSDEPAERGKANRVFHELATEYAGRVAVVTVSADKFGNLAAQYGVTTVPVAKVFLGGKLHETIFGLHAREEYRRVLDELLAGKEKAK